MYAVETRGLTKCFKTSTAVDDLNLKVPTGSIFGFLGPNGAGKTTTLRMLMGFARPTSGEAYVLSQKVGTDVVEYRKNLGYLPDVPSFYGWMRASEFLTFSGELFGMGGQKLKNRVEELLEIGGLAGVKTRIGGFSRGMKQRLGLLQAIIHEPKVVLLDEPTSALDPIGRKEVLDMISHFSGETTILFSTHILSDVERVCDTVAILDKGRLITQEPIQELKKHYLQRAVMVQVSGDRTGFAARLSELDWVNTVKEEKDGFHIKVDDLDVARKALPKLISEMGLGLENFRILEMTLEDIFVRLVNENEH